MLTVGLLVCVFISNVCGLDPNWRLIWNDEFTGSTLDATKWTARTESGNFGNSELQYYHPSHVSVSNDNLVLTSTNVSLNGMAYTSGKIDSKDLFYSTYGRYEVRAKLPAGKGLWPAAWLLPQKSTCWPLGGEIDILEFKGGEPNNVYGAYHYGACCGCDNSKSSSLTTSRVASDYHVFAVEWSPSNLTWYYDDVAYFTLSDISLKPTITTGIDASPHYWILNAAVGGSFSGNPDNSTPFPSYTYIDYVRVYVWRTSCDGVNACSGHGCCSSATVTCTCDQGWTGSSCEYWIGEYQSSFVTADPTVDSLVNGWGNGYALYLAPNAVIHNGLSLTLTNAGCPSGCGDLAYSAAAWTTMTDYPYGTFSFVAKTTNITGTAVALIGSTNNSPLQQIGFVFTGLNPTATQVSTWVNGTFQYQADLDLGFDASKAFHNYSFTYLPSTIIFYVDGVAKFTAVSGIPAARMTFGAYYSAQPAWYGSPFVFTGNSTAYVSSINWQLNTTHTACPTTTTTTSSGSSTSGTVVYVCDGGPTFLRNFYTIDGDVDGLVNGWGNGFTLYLSPNAVINGGLSLTLSRCPDCGSMNYSGAGWTSLSYFSYGMFTFIAKSTNISGTALSLGAVGSGAGSEQIGIVLSGATPTIMGVATWHSGVYYPHADVTLPFNANEAYHNYSFVYLPTAVTFYVDGHVYATVDTFIPVGPFAFGIYYAAQPDWYGPFTYTGPSATNISRVAFSACVKTAGATSSTAGSSTGSSTGTTKIATSSGITTTTTATPPSSSTSSATTTTISGINPTTGSTTATPPSSSTSTTTTTISSGISPTTGSTTASPDNGATNAGVVYLPLVLCSIFVVLGL